MAMIISYVAIGLYIQTVLSSELPNKVCVGYKSYTFGIEESIVGEYINGGLDETNENEYYTKLVGSNCYPLNEGDSLYIRYSMNSYQWEITWNLTNYDDYWYKCCNISSIDLLQCGNNHWYNEYNYMIPDLYIINYGECLPIHNETYLTVTGYSGGYEGCNGEYIIINGKNNLYKRIEDYDEGWLGRNEITPLGPIPHYWYYNYPKQGWICNPVESENELIEDYATTCSGPGTDTEGVNMNFHN